MLRRRERLRARLTVTFTPTGGTSRSTRRTVAFGCAGPRPGGLYGQAAFSATVPSTHVARRPRLKIVPPRKPPGIAAPAAVPRVRGGLATLSRSEQRRQRFDERSSPRSRRTAEGLGARCAPPGRSCRPARCPRRSRWRARLLCSRSTRRTARRWPPAAAVGRAEGAAAVEVADRAARAVAQHAEIMEWTKESERVLEDAARSGIGPNNVRMRERPWRASA